MIFSFRRTSVGVIVGSDVGSSVTIVGEMVGRSVGISVTIVGEMVGRSVGMSVTIVGDCIKQADRKRDTTLLVLLFKKQCQLLIFCCDIYAYLSRQ